MEQISSITEATFKSLPPHDWGAYDGFVIKTTEQEIQIGISNGQSCCESFGCLITNDETAEFIGTNLLSIEVVDTVLNNKELPDLQYLDCGDIMFVNIVTSAGVLQFVAYNSHNGYYGHSAVLVSKQLTKEQTL